MTEVAARGKHLLIRVEGGITVHTHLRMDGSLAGTPGPRAHRQQPPHPARARQRHLAGGRLPAGHRRGPAHREGSETWSATSARTCSAPTGTRRRRPAGCAPPAAPGLGEALLDQRNLAGIGNVYKARCCSCAGVHPWRPVGEVSGPRRPRRPAQQAAGREQGPDRARHHRDAAARPGAWVYGRAGRRCRRCGTVILGRGRGQGGDPEGRITFWCPHCQPPDPAVRA